MHIIDLKRLPEEQWLPTLLERYAYAPYWWIRGVTAESRRALLAQEITDALQSDKHILLGCLAADNDALSGFALLRPLNWDTRHFGYEIWRLDHLSSWDADIRHIKYIRKLLGEAVESVVRRRGQCIQARIPINNLAAIHGLEEGGFRTMEVLTTWLFEFAKSVLPAKQHPELVRDFQSSDTEALIDLARASYAPIPDRFHVDPHLSLKASNEMYAEWIRNSCNGQLADHIAVAASEGQPVGYATQKFLGNHEGRCNARIAQLGLGAASPTYRNKGLVTDLVIHNLEWLQQRRADYCFVGTQGNNIPPQRVWLKVGFKPAMMALTLHYWT